MAEERSVRSVFVGNIPYEATEEQLKDIFSRVGPVVSFRLVYDRETVKPKGYGFCEYQDQETAQSAMRNLNNFEIGGRPLRVGVAAGDQAKEEAKAMQQSFGGPIPESPYGEPVEPEKAPEAIRQAVASLPPEQMFELMKQMKLCIQNNPNEARSMLLQNAQLAYALLQGQIVMKIVDPQVALAMLHRPAEQIPPLLPTSTPRPTEDIPPQKQVFSEQLSPGHSPHEFGPRNAGGMPRLRGGLLGDMPPQGSRLMAPPFPGEVRGMNRPDISMGEPRMAPPPPVFGTRSEPREPREGPGLGRQGPEIMNERRDNIRTTDVGPPNKRPRQDIPGPRGANLGPPPRGMGGARGGDMRGMDMGGPRPLMEPQFGEDRYREGRGANNMGPRGFRSPRGMDGGYDSAEGGRGFEPGYRGVDMGRDMDNMRGPDPGMRHHLGPPQQNSESRDTDLRSRPGPGFPPTTGPSSRPNQEAPSNQNVSVQDQEKAALIMQVLQLSDEQIALLPPEQRQSILILKEQIASARGGNSSN